MIYWASPEKINLCLREELNVADGNANTLTGNWDKETLPFEKNSAFYKSLKQRTAGVEWEKTEYFQHCFKEIKSGKISQGCTDIAQLLEHCADQERAFHETKEFGFRQIGTDDCICIAIDREGKLLLSSGEHKLSYAKLLKIDSIPVKIVARHEEWEKLQGEINNFARSNSGKTGFPIDHPDFIHTPADNMGLSSLIIDHMLPKGKSILETDSSWGYLSTILEPLGRDCVALRGKTDDHNFIGRLRKATESNFKISEHDLLDYFSDQQKFDTVIALDSLPSLMESKEDNSKLKKLLPKVNTEELFTLTPVQRQAEDFAKLIIENSSLDSFRIISDFKNRKLLHIYKSANKNKYPALRKDFRLIFLAFINATYPQIFKKVHGQFKGLKANHPNSHCIVIGNGKDDVDTSGYDFDFIDLRDYQDGPAQKGLIAVEVLKRLSPDIIYMRYPVADAHLEYLTRHFPDIIFEHQTFEIEELEKSNPNLFYNELAFGATCMQRGLGGVGVTDEITCYERRRVAKDKHYRTMGNGIDTTLLPISKAPSQTGKIHALLVADFQFWHGLDRLIAGCIAAPEICAKFKFHLVGYGPALEQGKELIAKYGLEKSFVYHGYLLADKIGPIADLCSIGIGVLAPLRKSLSQTSALKHREFVLRGLPLAFAGEDTDLSPNMEFCHTFPDDETPIDLAGLYGFAKKSRTRPEVRLQVREYALNRLDWKSKMKTIADMAALALSAKQDKSTAKTSPQKNTAKPGMNEENSTKFKLETAVNQIAKTGKRPKNLYKAVLDFLKNEGESETLASWVMQSQLADGELKVQAEGNPLVSFIVPCYNHAEYLRECILSLLRQDFNSFEIIIINDGSTDNTDEVATALEEEFPTHRIRHINQENSGLVRSRNRGCTVAKGKYILPIDADDLIAPTFLSKTVPVLEAHPELGYVSTKALFFGHSNLIWPKNELVPANFFATNQQTCSTLFRKSMWKELGGYDERMTRGYEDWELWIRATKNGWIGTQIDEPLFFYRRKADSMITNSRQKDAEIKEQIVRLHPDIYDASRLKNFEKEMHWSNWIPPQLVRGDFKLPSQGGAEQVADREVEQQLENLKKHILGLLAQIDPRMKKHFLKSDAGNGEQEKFAALHKQISTRVTKLNTANQNIEAIDVAAVLLSLYPLERNSVLLFMDSLIKNNDFSTCYSVGSLYLSLWNWEKHILERMAHSLCGQADQPGNEDRALGFLEGATLLAPDYRLAWMKKFEFQIAGKLYRAAERTRKQAAEAGIKLPSVPLPDSAESKKEVKHIWYVTNAFGYIGGGINGVSQAKFMTLGSILANDDLCKVTMVTPLTIALPAGIAEFSRQYHVPREREDASWPDFIATVRTEPQNHLGISNQKDFTGEWLPCRLPEENPDLIIIEGVRTEPHDFLTGLGLNFDCPLLYMHHNSPYHFSGEITDDGSLPVMLKNLEQYTYNISVSRTVAEEWKSLPEQRDKQWFSIANCIREDEAAEVSSRPAQEIRRELGVPEQEFMILCLASVQHRKGQDILLSQMNEILTEIPNARLIFVGPVLPDRGGVDIVEMSKNQPYSDRVHFVGAKDNALDYIYASDLLVLPSREEALPLSIMEAMALGRTCVASDVYGIPEMIIHGETGLMFSLDQPQDLAKHIIRLGKNKAEREEMAAKAEIRYREHFSRERHAERWREVLEEIFSGE
ncbi:glycosyltransferase [Desulfovibrio sp. JC022]|uniref:glycosyltransferase n=1 Tax=Desulfovibrio sp. JC022 TaxID=2593642 RepID=UPI0013D5B9DF|nr:glycosyltransferase [Desulfovibrio sp. JC022]NDV23219.1 glycosyltransferase [Desulfovibrio sp. JC022]